MLYELRPIESDKWHGKKGQERESFARAKKWEAAIDPLTGKYDVELTEDEIAYLEKKTSYNLSLTPLTDKKPHPTWNGPTGTVVLPQYTSFLNDEKPIDKIRLAVLKRCPMVAPSEAQLMEYPHATHYLFSADEKLEQDAVDANVAWEAGAEVLKLTRTEKDALILLMEGTNSAGKSDAFVNGKLRQFVEQKPKEVLKYARMDKELFNTRKLVELAVYQGVLTKDNGYYYFGSESIGFGQDEVIEFLLDPMNQGIKLSIKDKVK